MDFIDGTQFKESACKAGETGDAGLIPGSGRSPKIGNNPRVCQQENRRY